VRLQLVRFLHLAALCAFALAQPLFDVLGRSPEFFAIRGSRPVVIVLLGLTLTLALPLLLLLVEALAETLRAGLGHSLHLAFVGLLGAVIALQHLARPESLSALLALALAAALGIVAAIAYARVAAARSALTVLSVAPLVFLALFLARSPLGSLDYERAASGANAGGTEQPHVVVVILDELPVASLMDEQGTIDAARFPSFAALARESTWYRTAVTAHGFTPHSVPALLTGRLPREERLPVVSDHPANLFTLLAGSHDMVVAESITRLCPERLCARSRPGLPDRLGALASDLAYVYLHVALPDALKDGLPSVTDTWLDFGGNRVHEQIGSESGSDHVARFEAYLRSLEAPSRPTLVFAHVFLPHIPWHYLPSGRAYVDPGVPGLADERWAPDSWLVEQAHARHLLQAGYADRLLGRLVARLRATRMWERAVVVVTSDHGVSFRPGGERRVPTAANVGDVALVPLFVKQPGQRDGMVVDEPVSTLDVLPTIARELAIELPEAVHGVPLGGRRGERPVFLDRELRPFPVTPAELVAKREAAVRAQVERFGSGDWSSVFRAGPRPELVGTPVGMAGAPLEPLEATVDQAGALAAVDLGAGRPLPLHLTGTVDTAAGTVVAVAVNGVVGATTRAWLEDGRVGFSALVPQTALRDGPNAVQLYAVRPERAAVWNLSQGGQATAVAVVR
jgi:hypothetical protein